MIYLAAVLLIAGIFAIVARAKAIGRDIDVELMADAIRMVENWDLRSPGAAGELGYWQITPGVWREFSSQPFMVAGLMTEAAETEQRRVAVAIILDIKNRLILIGRKPTPYLVALCYNAGFGCAIYHQPHFPSGRKIEYAHRAENIYREYSQ